MNPDTRRAQFSHLKDNALFQAIKDLPAWQQMQELTPWYRPIDVIIIYLRDEEGLAFRRRDDRDVPRNMGELLERMGM